MASGPSFPASSSSFNEDSRRVELNGWREIVRGRPIQKLKPRRRAAGWSSSSSSSSFSSSSATSARGISLASCSSSARSTMMDHVTATGSVFWSVSGAWIERTTGLGTATPSALALEPRHCSRSTRTQQTYGVRCEDK